MEKLRFDHDGVYPGNRRVSPRTALRAGAAGLTASALVAAGFGRRPTSAQEATPGASPTSGTMPDLTGVAPLPLTGERLAAFEAYVATKLAEMGVPGAAVAVVQDGAVAFLQGFGVREIDRPAPVTADTLLRIGSVTKSFSSLLTATLVDAGRLGWETPLVDLLPDFAVADGELTPRLTVRDAFSASTGLPRRDWELILNPDRLTPELVVTSIAELPLTAPYGEQYQYNNQLVAAGGFAAAVAPRTTSAAPTRSHCGSGCLNRSACRDRRFLSPTLWPTTTTPLPTPRTSPEPSTRCHFWRTTPG